MKKILLWSMASALVMLVLPCLAVTLIKGDGGMAVCLMLFFAINPIYAICSGIYAGRDAKTLWTLPIITAVLFLMGAWCFFDMEEKAFLLYGAAYLMLGGTAMMISMFISKKC